MLNKNDFKQIEKTTDLIKHVESLGYVESRGNGSSHRIFKCNGLPILSIPNSRIISDGTRRNIVKLLLGESYYSKQTTEQPQVKNMDSTQAWQYLVNNWNVKTWTPIPENVKQTLKLDSRVGMFSGMLISQSAANGSQEFINRLNNKKVK